MNSSSLHLSGLKRPGLLGRNRGVAYLYIFVALVLLSIDASGSRLPQKIRAYATDFISPMLVLVERPVRALQNGLERIAGVSDIYMENQRLKDENEQLARWRDAASQLMRENEQYRRMLKVPGRDTPIAATARVIGIGGGAFERSFVINAGGLDGVKEAQPVVDDRGLVGRVQNVGRWSSRVLLVTDLNSRIPVRVERTGALAIAEGYNEDTLRLRFLPVGNEVRVGDILVTSGHGSMFPPDLPVARIIEIDRDRILLDPAGLFNKIDYVRVMDYNPLNPDDTPLEEQK